MFVFTACNKKGTTSEAESLSKTVNKSAPNNPPEILITAGHKEIPYVIGLNEWNGAKYDREATFQTIMKKDSSIEIPYIPLDETIQIEFKGIVPDELQLRDYILKKDGTPKYTEKEVNEIPVKLVDGKMAFKLQEHMAAMLSSNTKDYEPGNTIRGFTLTCKWGDNECEYGFIIKTDAKK